MRKGSEIVDDESIVEEVLNVDDQNKFERTDGLE